MIRDAFHAMIVKCPFCVTEGRRSLVRAIHAQMDDVDKVQESTIALPENIRMERMAQQAATVKKEDVGFMDVEGRFHVHDDNTYTVVFQCAPLDGNTRHKFAGQKIRVPCQPCEEDEAGGLPRTPTPPPIAPLGQVRSGG